MNRENLADNVAAELKMGKGDVRTIVAKTVELLAKAMRDGEEVRLPGLGTFSVKPTLARSGKNPVTGADMNIPAGRKISFKVAADLKKAL